MRYRNETPDDPSIKEVVEKIYAERPTLDIDILDSRVQDYYYDVVGISSDKLWRMVYHYCEEVIHEQIEKNGESCFKIRQ